MAKSISFEFDNEFYTRVKHNFKLYVLLSSKGIHWNQDVILESIFRLNGYKCHKMVKYGEYSSHIHVKFEEEHLASEAVGFLNKMNSDLTAILVDDMLRDWFTYELRSGFGPPCTFTVVDTTGNPPRDLNFLTSTILNYIFSDFGGPYLLPYTAALSETHVQVLFGSMTEALAACMAFGEWYNVTRPLDSFFHRVRINPSNKEALLIKNSGGDPYDAFQLDYFIYLRPAVETCCRMSESDCRQNKTTQTKKSSLSKGSQKGRKHKQSTPATSAESENRLANQIGYRTPILCVPVIAPLNYSETLVAPDKQVGTETDFANAVVNFQLCCPVQTQAVVASGEPQMKLVQYTASAERLDIVGGQQLDQQVLSLEQVSARDSVPDVVPIPAPVPPKQHQAFAKQKSTQKGHSRVFIRKA